MRIPQKTAIRISNQKWRENQVVKVKIQVSCEIKILIFWRKRKIVSVIFSRRTVILILHHQNKIQTKMSFPLILTFDLEFGAVSSAS